MNEYDKEKFINEFSKALIKGKGTLFIGSGVSRKAGYAGWKDILKEVAKEIGLDVDKEQDLISLAHYYVLEKQRTGINQAIKEFFNDRKGIPQNIHSIITSLPINEIWTTNYDTLIERSYQQRKIPVTIITNDKSYNDLDPDAKVKIYKIHGTVTNVEKCIITRDDYDKFELNNDIVLSQLKASMCAKSFLFLGYSFSDTDIQHILFKIRLAYLNSHPQRHYCIVKKVNSEEYETDEDYQYALNKQKHYINDMQQYGINIILVDSYDEIDSIMFEIRNKIYCKNILISGSYDDKTKDKEKISMFTQKLACELIRNDYKIFTGFGENLGADIVSGVFEGCTLNEKKFEENVYIYPFPYRTRLTQSVKNLYGKIRSNMVDKTKIHIIICGEKNNHDSNGVYEEYLLSKQANNLIIPIAITGGTALKIWKENQESLQSSFVNQLNSYTDDLIELIIKYINGRIK